MRFTDLSVDAFGILTRLSIPALQPGLNVLLGPHGSGKTTLLEFIRGVFGGFGEARRSALISASRTSASGGSVGVEWGSRKLVVIRHGRPDSYETLAINVRQGRAEEGQALRKHLEHFDGERLRLIFTASGANPESLESLLALAALDGIALSSTGGEDALLRQQRDELRHRRHQLLDERQQGGRLPTMAGLVNRLLAERETMQFRRDEQAWRLAERRSRILAAVASTDLEIDCWHTELQAAQADWREQEDRLWSRAASARDLESAAGPTGTTSSTAGTDRLPRWPDEVDGRLDLIRQLLRELAAERLRLSLVAAEYAGLSTLPDAGWRPDYREMMRIIRQHADALNVVRESAGHSNETEPDLASSRRQFDESCRQLEQQLNVDELRQLDEERRSIDDCERELLRQAARFARSDGDRLTTIASPARTPSAQRDLAIESITDREPCAVAGPAGELAARYRDCRAHWQQALERRCDLERQAAALDEERWRLETDPALAECSERLRAAQVELSAGQTDWQSLLAAEAALCEAQPGWASEHSRRVIEEASVWLRALSCGRYRDLRVTAGSNRLQALNEAGASVPLHAAGAADGTQVAMAVRLALVDEYARRGLEFPLVLDEALADCDEPQILAAADVLQQACNRGRQVLVLTGREHVAGMLQQRGAAVHRLQVPGGLEAGPLTNSVAVANSGAPPRSLSQRAEDLAPSAAPVPALPTAAVHTERSQPAEHLSSDSGRFPATVHWQHVWTNRPESSHRIIASLGANVATMLERQGLFSLKDLLQLLNASSPLALDEVALSPMEFASCCAEGRLLLGVPHLRPEDAQLLVACGVLTPAELAAFHPETLFQRIQRFRGSTPHPWHQWMQNRNVWPQESDVVEWIDGAQRAGGTASLSSSLTAQRPPEPDDDPRGPRPPGPGVETERIERRRARRPSARRGAPAPATRALRGADRAAALPHTDGPPRYYLHLDSAVIDAPAIGPKTARLLKRSGILTVNQLVSRAAAEIANSLQHARINATTVEAWQRQSRLMCQVADLRGHDAQLLVACGVTSPDGIARHSAEELFAMIGPFAASREGQRILRSANPPSLAEAAQWIERARQARALRAA